MFFFLFSILVGFAGTTQNTSSKMGSEVPISPELQVQIQQALIAQNEANLPNQNRTLTATYVGSFQTNDGPNWNTNPQVYSGLEAAAHIFGGSPSDYAISTNPDTTDPSTITHTAFASTWGIGCSEVAEDYSLDLGAPGYNDPPVANAAISAYVQDWCFSGQTNYVWLVSTPPSTNSFITTWETTAPSQTITIPTTGGGYNYSVDWGDGSPVSSGVNTSISHPYAVPGVYTVKIDGNFPRIYFNNSGDRLKIKSIEQWGTNVWSSMNKAFMGCENLVSNATDMPNLSMVTDMYGMFAYAREFNGDVGFGSWDVSNVSNMRGMFGGASSFNYPIGNWNVSNVTNMEQMFNGATLFNQNLESWNVGKVTTMKHMFATAMAFNQNIGAWNVSAVTNMESMFAHANSFQQNIGAWNVTNVTNMKNMFMNVTLSTDNYDALLNGWNSQSLNSGVKFHGGFSKYCTGKAARNNMTNNLGWTINDGGQLCNPADAFITTWTTTSPNELITIPTTGIGYYYDINWDYDENVPGIWETHNTGNPSHIYPTAGTYTVAIRGIFPRIFFADGGNKLKIRTIEQWGTNKWKSMNSAFMGCENLISNATDTPNLSLVTDMTAMFAYARIFNGSINMNNWNVSTVTNMNGMFGGASAFNSPIGNWNVSNVTNMENMFNGATVFNQNIGAWNVGNVTNMKNMFATAMTFNQSIGNWNVSNVTTMNSMFSHANSFNQNIGAWNVSNVTNMTNMFKNVKLSTSNYDALLNGWTSRPLKANVKFSGGFSNFCAGEAARAYMINSRSWTITDGGKDCTDPCGNVTEFTASGWTNGAPSINNKAIFSHNYTSALDGGSIDACAIVIKAGVTVKVSAGTVIRAEYNMDIDNAGKLIFESTATGNGELGILGPNSTINGNATVQRYISANRAFRMVSPAVTTTTSIKANWQEGVNNTGTSYMDNINPNPGFGTHITGSQIGANGFDATILGNPSMFKDNIITQSFEAIPNTDFNTLSAGNGYMLYVRGDRSLDLTDNNSFGETVLRATGQLAVGSQPQNYMAPSTGAHIMFGNPYQTAVDVAAVFGSSTNINPHYYYVYDATLGTIGAYVTVDLDNNTNSTSSDPEVSEANRYLQPGQAAQLATLAPGAVVVDFRESYKTPGEFTTTNATGNSALNDVLIGQLFTQENHATGGPLHDSFKMYFASENSNALTAKDAYKPLNFEENLGINHNGTNLSIENRDLPEGGENFPLFINGYQHTDYVLKMELTGLDNVTIYLEDQFQGTRTLLEQGTIVYPFSIDRSNPSSLATDRFIISVGERLGGETNTVLNGVTLYPNPMENLVYLANPNGLQLESISIYDLAGRLIKTVDIKGATSEVTLDVSNLSKSTYMVVINGEGGRVSKLMVKK